LLKILITSGGTTENMDAVRVMTNISTGKLGAIITEKLAIIPNYKIYYVHGIHAVLPFSGLITNIELFPVRSVKNAMDTMKKLIVEEEIDVVIHSMAVSDFTFNTDIPLKLKSNDPIAFLEALKGVASTSPKIISYIKTWRPQTFLIGFKFEVGIGHDELIALAKNSIEKNGCDLVIANDKVKMQEANSHVAHFVFSDELLATRTFSNTTVSGKKEIAMEIAMCLGKLAI